MAKTAAQTRNASKAPLSLKVTLYGIKPPVWRRLLIPGEMTLGDLHQAIQAAMGWGAAISMPSTSPAASMATPTASTRWPTRSG